VYYLLFYDYVDNVLDRRAPFRESHLALVKEYVDRSEIVLAGAFSDPVDGAVLAFKTEDPSRIEAFVSKDPYVANGLVTRWRCREWSVVAGTACASREG